MRKKLQLTGAFILLMMFGFVNVITAQEQVTNGDLELWDNSTTPTGYDKAENITQETDVVYAGTYSAKQQAGTSDLQQLVGGVVAGQSYTISYYYLDNDVDARSRIWSYWTSGGSTLSDNAAELRSSVYSTDDPAWQLWTVTLVAPATADGFKFEVRSYNDNSGGGFIYYDDLSVFGGGAATPTISKAYAISDTELEVIYTVDVTSVNAGDYSLTGTSAITFSSATIDGSNAKLVHLTGPSVDMAGDITLDNIADAGSSSDYDFYAGIMPISNTNVTNSGGIVDNVHFASYIGIISANDGYNNVWMSDAAGERDGVLIFDYDFDGLVSVGDEIIISAPRTTYNGLTELVTPDLISINSSGNTPYGPTIIDGSDINATIPVDTDPGEMWEGQLVKIENVTVDSYVDYEYTCSWSDGTSSYIFYLKDNVDYHLNNVTLNVGSTYAYINGVIDWYNSGPYYSINPRNQADIVFAAPTDARIIGSMNGWNLTDPDYVMALNANGLFELTKSLDAGDHEYKVIEGDTWDDPNYPGNNQHIILAATESVTWKANIDAELVTHLNPVVAGDFLSSIGGTNWEPTELLGEMTDLDGDDIFTLELTIPEGNYEAKVTLNHNWDQNTGDNVAFTTDGVNSTIFTYDFPNNITTISAPPPQTATINLSLGWTWFSLNLEGDDMSLNNVLSSLTLSENDYIKNQTSSATYYEGTGWYGALTEIDPTQMYQISLVADDVLEFSGMAVDPSTPINLNAGWTWIGYLPQAGTDISTALASLSAVQYDYIKNQVGSATYYDEYGWYGALETMDVYDGFKISMLNADVLVYPNNSMKSATQVVLPIFANNTGITVDPYKYEFNGTVTAKVTVDGKLSDSENDLLFAYVGNECRGISNTMYFKPTDSYAYQLMIYSNVVDGEIISFRYFDSQTNMIYECSEVIEFTSDMVMADAFNSLNINTKSTLSIDDNMINNVSFKVYPNPTSGITNIEYTLNETSDVHIVVSDIYGKQIEVIENQVKTAGNYSLLWNAKSNDSGTYFVKIICNNSIQIRKVVLLK